MQEHFAIHANACAMWTLKSPLPSLETLGKLFNLLLSQSFICKMQKKTVGILWDWMSIGGVIPSKQSAWHTIISQ